MATDPHDIEGPIALTYRMEALPGKADELAQWFANLKAHAESNLEPGTLLYKIARFGDTFTSYEEYADADALIAHTSSLLCREFLKIASTLGKIRCVVPANGSDILVPDLSPRANASS